MQGRNKIQHPQYTKDLTHLYSQTSVLFPCSCQVWPRKDLGQSQVFLLSFHSLWGLWNPERDSGHAESYTCKRWRRTQALAAQCRTHSWCLLNCNTRWMCHSSQGVIFFKNFYLKIISKIYRLVQGAIYWLPSRRVATAHFSSFALWSTTVCLFRAYQAAQWWRTHLLVQEMCFWPCVGKIPWRKKWQSTPVFLPGKSPMDRGA